jgi:hypothetical protein
MANFRPNREAIFAEHDGFPEVHQPYTPGATYCKFTIHAAPLAFAFPNTKFFVATGFEVGFGLHTAHRPQEIWGELLKLVARKDRVGNDHLIITVGGPDRNGYAFPSEEYLAGLACRLDRPTPKLKHLSKVWVHFWSSGLILEIAPARGAAVTAGFGSGLVPSYFSFEAPLKETEMTVPRGEQEPGHRQGA